MTDLRGLEAIRDNEELWGRADFDLYYQFNFTSSRWAVLLLMNLAVQL